jgi:hypothetical protein
MQIPYIFHFGHFSLLWIWFERHTQKPEQIVVEAAGISLARRSSSSREAERELTKERKLIATTNVLGQSTFLSVSKLYPAL